MMVLSKTCGLGLTESVRFLYCSGTLAEFGREKQTARTWITDEVELPLGMKVMAMFNISMDLGRMNGAQEHTVD